MEKLIDTLLKIGITSDGYLFLLDKSGKPLPQQTKLTLINDLQIDMDMVGVSACRFELLVDTREIKKLEKL